MTGTVAVDRTVQVQPDWDLLGPVALSPFDPVLPEWFVQPAGRVTPPAYGWDGNAYVEAIELECGKGYWIRIRQPGELDMGSY